MVRVQRLKHAYIAAVFTRFGVGACRPQSQRLCHQRMPKQLRYHALPASPFLLLDKSAGRCQSGGLQRPRLLICKRLLCVCVFATGCVCLRLQAAALRREVVACVCFVLSLCVIASGCSAFKTGRRRRNVPPLGCQCVWRATCSLGARSARRTCQRKLTQLRTANQCYQRDKRKVCVDGDSMVAMYNYTNCTTVTATADNGLPELRLNSYVRLQTH